MNSLQRAKTIFFFSSLAAMLVASFSLVWGFSEPTLAPPGGNVAAPINVSGIAQTKAGSLGIGTADFPTVNAFGANKAVQFAVGGIANIGDLLLVSGGDIGNWFGTANAPRSWIGHCPANSGCSGIVKGGDYLHISGWSNPNYGSVSGNARRVLGLADVVLVSHSLGISTGDQSRAKLVTAGMEGNTLALFGQDVQGVSLIGNWPGIAFNSYFNNGVWKSISSGWSGDISYFQNNIGGGPSDGGFVFRVGEQASGPDQTVGHKDIFYLSNSGTNFLRGGAFVLQGNGYGRTDFVMNGDRGPGGRALVLDWGNKLVLNYGGDFTGGVEVGSKLNAPQLCLNNDCRTSWPGGGGTPNLQQVTDVGNTTNRDIGITCCGNLRLWGGIYDTYGGGDSWFLDLDRDARIRQMQVVGPLYVGPDYVRGGAADGDLKVAGRISSQNLSVACPNGWGCGVHTWDVYADASIYGTYITSPNKFFTIPHPLDPENKVLVHATIEGPESAVFYRGADELKNGKIMIRLPNYFEALTRKEGRTVLLTNIDGFDRLAVQSQEGAVAKDGTFIVISDNQSSNQRFSWEVKAVRADVKPLKVERDKNALPYDEDQLPKGVTKPNYAK